MTLSSRPLPIRTRLALLYTGLLVAALVIFGGGLYLVLQDALSNSFNQGLLDNAEHARGAFAADVDPYGRLQPSASLLAQFASTGGRVTVFGPDGSMLADSAAPGTSPLPIGPDELALAAQHAYGLHDVTAAGDTLRLAIEPIDASGGSLIGYVAWAESTRPLRDLLRTVVLALVLGGLLVSGLALAAGWRLARRALAPVADVTETARAISLSGDFAARVEAGPAGDEIGDLAVAFNEMLAALESNHQALQRFLGDASHELRTPLTTIRASLDLAQRPGLDPEERRSILADAQGEASRMGRLIGDLLSLARADSGTRLTFAPIELDAILLESVRQQRGASDHVHLSIERVEPAIVDGDRDRLKELFLILLENAARYTPPGGGRDRGARAGRRRRACVDRGHRHRHRRGGSRPPLRASLPRSSRTRAAAVGHRPRARDRPVDRHRPRRLDPAGSAAVGRHGRHGRAPRPRRMNADYPVMARVLVVDDEPPIVDLVRGYLEREGMAVEARTDGPAALAAVRELSPDVVVLDVMLPGLDGVEVCRRMRAFSDAYVIMLTARTEEIDQVVGLSVGADDYLAKPFSPRELVARIKALLRRPRATGSQLTPSEAGQSGPRPTDRLAPGAPAADTAWVRGNLALDLRRRMVVVRGESVELTALEFELLALLAREPGVVLTRQQLLDCVWGEGFVGDEHVVDVHIANLRRKLGDPAAQPSHVETVRGVGYRYRAGARSDERWGLTES